MNLMTACLLNTDTESVSEDLES